MMDYTMLFPGKALLLRHFVFTLVKVPTIQLRRR